MKKERIIVLLETLQAENAERTIGSFEELENVLQELRKELRTENNKKAGSANTAKAALDIIKNAKTQPNRWLHGAIIDGEKAYVCDGFRALSLVG